MTKTSVTARIKEIKGDKEAKDELEVLQQYLKLFDMQAKMKKKVTDAQGALDKAVFAKYPELTEKEIKILVVDDKWQATLEGNIKAEIERVRQQLAGRVKVLDERYAETLPELEMEVENWANKVEEDLQLIMGDG